jgi:8-oxo-dGTP diphosphatase
VNYRNPRPTVTGLVLYQNKLLLTRRAVAPFKDWWDLPGGFMDRGESPQEAIQRELREETGLAIAITRLFGIYPGTFPDDFDPFHILSMVYLAESPTDAVGAFDDVSQSKWFARDSVPEQIAFDSNQKIINDFFAIWN